MGRTNNSFKAPVLGLYTLVDVTFLPQWSSILATSDPINEIPAQMSQIIP